MSAEQPVIITVPTELNRSDGFVDLSVLLMSGLAVWWLALRGVPIWAFIPMLVLLAIFVLTGEPAGDIPFVGAIAAGLRSKLGLRRAHEWVMAYCHYFKVRQWPDFCRWFWATRVGGRIRGWQVWASDYLGRRMVVGRKLLPARWAFGRSR